MSAIFGILNITDKPVEEMHLRKMQEEVGQYGRDGQGILIEQNIGLGCCLSKFGILSETDIPVYNDDRFLLVCDALIYNRAELCEKYGLGDNKNLSLQALILEAYKKWGEDCPKYINGDFTFAVWDKQTHHLFIARDHLGVRPLYYFFDGKVFAFATDYRALLVLPFVGKRINEVKLYCLLSNTYHIDPEATYFEQIKRLPQAYALIVCKHDIQKYKYWSPGMKKILYQTEEEYANALYDIVNDAIKLRINCVQDGIGSELSGGLDSSVVTVLANREMKKAGKKPFLLSWSPPFELLKEQHNDERKWIEKICEQEGLECRYVGHSKDIIQKEIHKVLPTDTGNGQEYRIKLRIMLEQNARFIFSGWGGDEGVSHRANLHELFARGYWWFFLKEIYKSTKGSPLRFCKQVFTNTVMPLITPHDIWGNIYKNKPVIIKRIFLERMKNKCRRDTFYFKINPLKYVQSGVIQSRTELLAWVDADYNMQHFFPFLDYHVVDYAMSIPGHWYYKNGLSRYIFCKAFEKILPKNLCTFTTKEDIAALTYRHETFDVVGKVESTIKRIDPEIFSEYIDFEHLYKWIDNPKFNKSPEICRFMLKIIEPCCTIQQCLTEIKIMK